MEIKETRCRVCGKEFTEEEPIHSSFQHKRCYNQAHYLKYKKTPKRPELIKKDSCICCNEPFTEANPYFSKDLHKKCYHNNYAKMSWQIYKKKHKEINSYNKIHNLPLIRYKKRDYHKRNIIKETGNEKIWKVENVRLLNDFKRKMEKTSGWADMADCFIIVHLFEIYYPYATTYLDSEETLKQIQIMWNWLKDFEYK